jgi:hypothetical protein
MKRFKLTQSQAARLPRLLRMEYTLRELATELEVDSRHIRQACDSGCPHRQDAKKRTWINGEEFKSWYLALVAGRKQKLAEGEAYCLSCRAAVQFTVEQVITQDDGVGREEGTCPRCGRRINRFRGKAE